MIKKCQTCKKKFDAERKSARFCSKRCYRRSPEAKAYQKNYDATSPAKLKYWYSEPGRLAYRRNASKKQIIVALERLGVVPESREAGKLYYQLVDAVMNRDEKAREILRGGIPDAKDGWVEFKFGIDFLRADQLIADILEGRRSKVRWLPSWDALEKILEGGVNDSSLFDSYQNFISYCENAKKF
jgi:hypothetical protein